MQNIPVPSHVIVAMSGGVDSSVAAYLLKKAGHHVEGIFMKNWEDDGHCPAALDINDAASVCEFLNINFHIVNFSNEYWQHVFSHFLCEYRAGRTPNPDVLCNKEIKFKEFLEHAKQRGADYIATGHYVRRSQNGSSFCLQKGRDPEKDQSYFLYGLTKLQLAESIFPVGELSKSQVRTLAKEVGLANYAKKDSTGICFIGERHFKSFLNEYLPAKPGIIESIDGEVLGEHDGLMFYTIGQRQGLKIGGLKGRLEAAWYVAAKDIQRNKLIVVQGNHPALLRKDLLGTNLHWINQPPDSNKKLTAKIRYRQKDQSCFFENDRNTFRVTFEKAQRAVTPGQSIVFYQDDICLGGGIIT